MLSKSILSIVLAAFVCLATAACTTSGNGAAPADTASHAGGGY